MTATASSAAYFTNKNNASVKAAYDTWLDAGNTGTKDEFLDWIKETSHKIPSSSTPTTHQTSSESSEPEIIYISTPNNEARPATSAAYNFWLSQGNRGTQEEFISWIRDAVNKKANDEAHQDNNNSNNSCSNNTNNNTPPSPKESPFDNVKFDSYTTVFDETPHEITVTNVPAGTQIHYANNIATDMGVHRAFVRLYREDLGEKLLTATITIVKADIKGIAFSDASFTYDGGVKNIQITGEIPEGVEVQYFVNNSPFAGAKDVGVYHVTAVLSGSNYDDLALTATLTIDKAHISGLSFNDQTFEYDTTTKNITITGSLPSGTSVAYTDLQGNAFKGAVIPEVYGVKATISGSNYHSLELTATLTINKANIKGITFIEKSVLYDGEVHNVTITGAPPSAVTVKYTLDSEDGDKFTGAVEPGVYDIFATLTGEHYNKLVLTTKLIIAPARLDQVTNVSLEQVEVPTFPIGSPTTVISFDPVDHAGSYDIHLYHLDGTPAAVVNTPETTYDLRAGVWEMILRDNYHVEVIAMPESGDPNHAPSLPSEAVTYKHIGKLHPPQNIRIEDGFVKWDPVPEAQAYYLLATRYNSIDQVMNSDGGFLFDITDLKISIDSIRKSLGLQAGNYRFSLKASTLIGVAWSSAYESGYGEPTDLVKIE